MNNPIHIDTSLILYKKQFFQVPTIWICGVDAFNQTIKGRSDFFKKNSIDAFLGEDGDVCCTSCPKYSFFMPSISKEDLENDPLFSSNRVCNYQNDPLLKDFHWVSAFYDTAGNFSFFAKKDPCIMDFSLVDVLARNGKLRKYEVPAILPEFDSILTLSQIKEGGEITRKRMRDLSYSLMDFTFE